jgi:hypothetical protein
MAGIIWLASYPKSGNTWLRAFIHNLMRNASQPYDINRLDDLVASGSSRQWYDAAHSGPTSDLGEAELLRLRPNAHAQIARRSSDDSFVKTHSRMGRQSGIDLTSASLSAGAIYIIRNPLEVAVSAADHFGISLDQMIETMENRDFRTASDRAHVPEYIGDWSAHVESWTAVPDRRLLILRYEDLMSAPRREFGRLCTFLGLRPSRERLERAIQYSSFDSLRAQEKSSGFKERAPHSKAFFRSGRPDSWRGALSLEQAQRICASHARTMQRHGYPASPKLIARESERRVSNA